jgi:hypothetical protein
MNADTDVNEGLAEFEGAKFHFGYASVAEIDIGAAAGRVWPELIDMKKWVEDFDFKIVSGTHGEEGELNYLWPAGAEGLHITAGPRTSESAIVLKTLTIVPNKLWYGVNPWRVRHGIGSTGANILTLTEIGAITRVTAIRSKEYICRSDAEREKLRSNTLQYQPIAQARWTDKYLPRLKLLSEGG